MIEGPNLAAPQQQHHQINQSCCEHFIDSLSRLSATKNILKLKTQVIVGNELQQEFVINNDLNQSDIELFLNFCNSWPQKQCSCVFKDDTLEKLHHFIHNLIAIAIILIKNLPNDSNDSKSELMELDVQARLWTIEQKEKLFLSLIKVFSLNMPLYITCKHILTNHHGRYTRSNECSCSKLNQDSLSLIQVYCQSNHKIPSQDFDNNLPIEYLRNICHFVDLNGLNAIKFCFKNALPDNLPLSIAHLLFSIIVSLRVWLNPNLVEQQIMSMRALVINYMCLLSDKDLRLAGTRNTTELMYESFKLTGLSSFISNSNNAKQSNCLYFKIDRDGLSLAYKYLTSTTLTIRLCGIAQMNLQISAWSEFNSISSSQLRISSVLVKDKNELADWFIENNIIEYLYGPNLHVEVVKRSQDIVNFLAFTNRLTEKHLDIIWASAQLKHCSKPLMDTLMSLNKHLNVESIQYLSRLISKLDISQQNEQTLLLSALLTKSLWTVMLDLGDEQTDSKSKNKCKKSSLSSSSSTSGEQEELDSQDSQVDTTLNGLKNDQLESLSSDLNLKKPQKILKRHNQSMDTQMSTSGDERTSCLKRKQIVKDYVNSLNEQEDDEEEDDDADYEDEDEESEDDEEDEEEDEDDEVDHEVERVLSSRLNTNTRSIMTRNKKRELEGDDTNDIGQNTDEDEEMIEINKIILSSKLKNKNEPMLNDDKSLINLLEMSAFSSASSTSVSASASDQEDEDDQDGMNSHSSNISNPSSVKNMKEFDEEDEQNEAEDQFSFDHGQEMSNQNSHTQINTDLLDDNDRVQFRNKSASSSKSSTRLQQNENFDKNSSKNNNENVQSSNSGSKLDLSDICLNGNTFLWDLLIHSHNSTDADSSPQNSDLNVSSLSNADTSKHQNEQKILKEAEKQLQTLLCLPSTDRRIRFKFIEHCLLNLKQNRSCTVSLRLLIKLFNSFQQFTSNSFSYIEQIFSLLSSTSKSQSQISAAQEQLLNQPAHSHQSNLVEIHKIVALTQLKFGILETFFENLKQFCSSTLEKLEKLEKPSKELVQDARAQVISRLHFLSFIFSSLGSPRDFELPKDQVELLWDSLIKFDDYELNLNSQISIKDDLFNWFLYQAKNKDQHAISIETFKLIFLNKIPLLDPNNFSQNALHLYQELFKIYKFSFNNSNSSDHANSIQMSELQFKQMEQSAIDYITKLAFKSLNNDVSQSAIQFLNSHYTQIDTITSVDHQEQFIRNCLLYLNEACTQIEHSLENENQFDSCLLTQVQRGLVLLKNHLELFQRRNAYQLRIIQIRSEQALLNHAKLVDLYSDTRPNSVLTINCEVNSTQFKFGVVMSQYDCVGDLKACVREILLNIIKCGKSDEFKQNLADNSHKIVFNSAGLKSCKDLYKRAYDLLIQGSDSVLTLVKALVDNEDELNIKLFTINGQEITMTQLIEAKFLQEIGIKDQHTIHVSLFAKLALNNSQTQMNGKKFKLDQNCIPMLILCREANFSRLFRMINLMSEINLDRLKFVDLNSKKRAGCLGLKLWIVISMLPSSQANLESIRKSHEWHLRKLVDHFVDESESLKKNEKCFNLSASVSFERPYQLLYYLQLIEVVFKQESIDLNVNQASEWAKYLYKLILQLTKHLASIEADLTLLFTNEPSNSNLDVLLDCSQIIFKMLLNCLFEPKPAQIEEDSCETPRKKTKRSNTLITAAQKQAGLIGELRLDMLKHVLDLDDQEVFLSLILNLQQLASLSQSESSLDLLQNSMQLLLHSLTIEGLKTLLISQKLYENRLSWFKSLILLDNSILFRRDACSCLYRLCLVDSLILDQFLNELLSLLPLSLEFRPQTQLSNSASTQARKINCKDFYSLLNTLMSQSESTRHLEINFDQLLTFILDELFKRECFETQNQNSSTLAYLEDDLITGLLSLGVSVLKHKLNANQRDKMRSLSAKLVNDLFDYLFKLATDPTTYPRIKLPKLRSSQSRSLCFDFLLELCRFDLLNFQILYEKLLVLNKNVLTHQWDYWPRDDVRSVCGYLGLVNLGATCYMATSLQHLFMIKEARYLILNSRLDQEAPAQHDKVLCELKKIFAFLQESERKAYNPKDLCKVYIMDQQEVNTGEQKDMQEFFTDLISKLEETSDPGLKTSIKTLFGGVITNMVISLDCSHVSSTLEEFYTVRCQVAGMKDLYESLNEITVKDTLEGDNMYTCSKCSRKVRAEKRACFRQLPNILCFNTMRYTFNMVTMLKEKVNTHFSFPLQLNMSGYMEQNLINNETSLVEVEGDTEEFMYDLIGVTVHTGTADGGHYYSFIRDDDQTGKDKEEKLKWYLFNDAEVKQFDADSQLASECFGGEATSKTYDSQSDKFMDMSFEKTNSAYMLFYEKKNRSVNSSSSSSLSQINEALVQVIFEDNLKFLKDRLIYETGYFNFVYQLCEFSFKTSGLNEQGARLGSTFFLETYINARDKPNMTLWVDILTKLFNSSINASKWFLTSLIEDDESKWLIKVFFKCPNAPIRQAFQRSLLNIIANVLKEPDLTLIEGFITKYLTLISVDSQKLVVRYMSEYFGFLTEFAKLGVDECLILLNSGCVQKCAKFYLKNRHGGVRRNLNKKNEALSPCVSKSGSSSSLNTADSDSESESSEQSDLNVSENEHDDSTHDLDDEDEDEDIIPMHDQKSKLKVFEKVLALIALLVEKNLHFVHSNHHHSNHARIIANFGLKFSFFNKIILDDLNLNAIRTIFFSLIRSKICFFSHSFEQQQGSIELEKLEKRKKKFFKKLKNFASKFVQMCIKSIKKLQKNNQSTMSDNDRCMPFFNALGSLFLLKNTNEVTITNSIDSSSCPNCKICQDDQLFKSNIDFVQIIIDRLRTLLLDTSPYHSLQWLISVCSLEPKISDWLAENMPSWVRPLLVESKHTQIRFSAAILLVNLVPNRSFRRSFTSNRNMLLPFKLNNLLSQSSSESSLSDETITDEINHAFDSQECKQVMHRILKHLFDLIDTLEAYVNPTLEQKSQETSSSDSNDSNPKIYNPIAQNTNSNHLIQYFTLLIYFMCSRHEKLLFVTYNQTVEKFWSKIYYPHIANNHICSNLNKQVSVHFLFHCLNNCTENLDYICEYTIQASTSHDQKPKIMFTSGLARELPMCTVVVDHEDVDLISYNRQCLHPYYATLRLLFEHSKVYLREMCQHTNFQWAFKHIMPYSIQYPQAVLELVKLVQLFVRQEPLRLKTDDASTSASSGEEDSAGSEDDDDEESLHLQQVVLALKENLCTQFLISPQIDPKQCWQSIVLLMKTIIQTFDDATLVLTRRGLSNLTICFFQISLIYHHNLSQQNEPNSGLSSTNANHQSDLCDCMQILLHLCETVKHHLDKRTEGIRVILANWKEKFDLIKRLFVLVNFYTHFSVRNRALDLIRCILGISQPDLIQNCVGIIWSGYFSSNLSLLNQYSSSCQSCLRGSIISLKQSVNSLSQCQLSSQLITQAVNLMGPYFPLTKKLTQTQISSLLNKQSKPVFNMFLPIMFVTHSHLDGAILLPSQIQQQQAQQVSLDYEKLLVDNYVPYLTFFDYLCQTVFTRPSQISEPSNQTLKQLIDLILFITQQSVLLNISFISYLNTQLSNERSASEQATTSNTSIDLTLFNLVSESPQLSTFMRTILSDYRYLINRKEIYDFFNLFMNKFMQNLSSSNTEEKAISSKQSQIESNLKTSILSINLKSIISQSLCSINEIRFYFEFLNTAKKLTDYLAIKANQEPSSSNSNLDCDPTDANTTSSLITLNLDFKSSHILGSIKTIHLILQTIVTSNPELNPREKQFFKFIRQLKHFFLSYNEYLDTQYTAMCAFLDKHTKSSSNEAESSEDEPELPSDSNDSKMQRNKQNSTQKTKKIKFDDLTILKNSQLKSPLGDQIMKQVELKRKALNHIIQSLVQTLHLITSFLDLDHENGEDSEKCSDHEKEDETGSSNSGTTSSDDSTSGASSSCSETNKDGSELDEDLVLDGQDAAKKKSNKKSNKIKANKIDPKKV